MFHKLMIGAVSAAALTLSAAALAQQGQFGTEQEAKAMLNKVVAAVKADQAVALAMFQKERVGLRTGTFIRSVSEPGTRRHSSVRPLFQLVPTLEP